MPQHGCFAYKGYNPVAHGLETGKLWEEQPKVTRVPDITAVESKDMLRTTVSRDLRTQPAGRGYILLSLPGHLFKILLCSASGGEWHHLVAPRLSLFPAALSQATHAPVTCLSPVCTLLSVSCREHSPGTVFSDFMVTHPSPLALHCPAQLSESKPCRVPP